MRVPPDMWNCICHEFLTRKVPHFSPSLAADGKDMVLCSIQRFKRSSVLLQMYVQIEPGWAGGTFNVATGSYIWVLPRDYGYGVAASIATHSRRLDRGRYCPAENSLTFIPRPDPKLVATRVYQCWSRFDQLLWTAVTRPAYVIDLTWSDIPSHVYREGCPEGVLHPTHYERGGCLCSTSMDSVARVCWDLEDFP
jgi:hypothetical protein